MNLKKIGTGAFLALIITTGLMAGVPRMAQAAEDNEPLNRLLRELIVVLTEQVETLVKEKASENSSQNTAASSGDSTSSQGSSTSASGSSNATTTTATTATSAETSAIVADTSCAAKDKPQKFPVNKELFKEKIRHLDIAGLLSAKVSVRVYDNETIVKTKMQKKEDIFKTKKRNREDIYDVILDRYGFTKSMINAINALASDSLKKTISIHDCRTVKTPPLE